MLCTSSLTFIEVKRTQHNLRVLLVYVIGLHAVQFGNNWMKKNAEDSQNWTRS